MKQMKEGELLLFGGNLINKKWKKGYFLVKDGFLEHSKAKAPFRITRVLGTLSLSYRVCEIGSEADIEAALTEVRLHRA